MCKQFELQALPRTTNNLKWVTDSWNQTQICQIQVHWATIALWSIQAVVDYSIGLVGLKIIGHTFSKSRLRDFWNWFYKRLTYLSYCH